MEMNISQPDQYSPTIQIIGKFWKKEEFDLFKEQIIKLFDKGARKIIIDLSRMSFISIQGLGLFMDTYSKLKEDKCELALNGPKGCVKEMIELSGFDTFMKIS